VIARIRDALGSFTGSMLGLAIIAALIGLPVFVVLWIGTALGVPWAIEAQARIVIWTSDAFASANELLPAWAWFAMISLFWLAFLDVHVRALVRDELSKHLTRAERKDP
jgi:hypothetical protein